MRKRLRIAEPRVPRGRMIPRKKEPAGEVAGSFGGSEFFLGRSDEEREHNLQPELLDAGLNLRFRSRSSPYWQDEMRPYWQDEMRPAPRLLPPLIGADRQQRPSEVVVDTARWASRARTAGAISARSRAMIASGSGTTVLEAPKSDALVIHSVTRRDFYLQVFLETSPKFLI